MGVTLYYHGSLHRPETVHDLITEMIEITKSNKWSYSLLDDPWDTPVHLKLRHVEGNPRFEGNAGLKGIIISPHPESEPVWLLFDKDGILRTPMNMIDPEEERESFAFTKTQFAGVDLHIQLAHLLEYVGGKFMKEWNLEDDCGYLKHRNREKAAEVFHLISDAINAVDEAVSTIEFPTDMKEDDPEFIAMVEKRIKTYLPGAEIRAVRMEEE